MMNYIYGYQNKITGKWYVGQTSRSIKERHRSHLSSAYHNTCNDYNCLFHKKIREYGIENFELILLEEVADKSLLDEREQYWIKEKHSFVKDNGYNLTTGGQQRKNNEDYQDIRQKFSNEEIKIIYELIKDENIKLTDIANEFNVSLSLICMINSGEKYHNNDLIYPLRKQNIKISEEIADEIISLLKKNKGNAEIAKIYGIDEDIVYRINKGLAHKRNITYPIRKISNKKQELIDRANIIKSLLKENKLNNRQIANLVGCDPSVVSNINYGKNYYDDTLSYPLRKS